MKKKQKIVSFKIDEDLHEVIKTIPNRSEFIRSAITAALGCHCPLCCGTGTLTPNQRRHWDEFAVNHTVKRCNICNEFVLDCLHPH